MAEAIAKHLLPEDVPVYSAGSAPSKINPHAVAALAEIGLDADAQYSKGVDQVPIHDVKWLITLCAEEVCPIIPGVIHVLHWPHPDPGGGSPEEALASFCAVRDLIYKRCEDFVQSISPESDFSPM